MFYSICEFYFQQGNQVRPLLIDRGTSPLLKEVYVKSFNDQATQTDITSLDERLKLLDHSSDRGMFVLTLIKASHPRF